jgi:hypothetical protein
MTIGIDFDGTCLTHSFPELGKDIGAVPVLRELTDAGHRLILWTMRCDSNDTLVLENGYVIHSGPFLTMAVDWFRDNNIPLWAIQRNPEQDAWTSSPKALCDLYIDDAALGAPLTSNHTLSGRPFLDWSKAREMLVLRGVIPNGSVR